MLTKKELLELKNALQTSKKTLIFFDDDNDGVCSFLLYYKYAKGFSEDIKGVICKDGPELKGETYSRRIQEYVPEKIFVLDKAIINQDFLDEINVPVYWLDHHPLVERKKVNYFNPMKHKSLKFNPDSRPTSYWAYKTIEDKDQKMLWLAMIGCTADWHIPEFTKDFIKKYPELLPKNIKEPGKVLHETELGKLSRILEFNIKGNTQESMTAIKILTRIEDPYEILNQTTPQGKFIYKNYERLNKIFEEIKSRVQITEDKIILFEYDDNYSLTKDLATEISYFNPEKLVMICRQKNDGMKCSLRSQTLPVREILQKALVGINGHGGGHEKACGAGIPKEDFEKFLTNIRAETAKIV